MIENYQTSESRDFWRFVYRTSIRLPEWLPEWSMAMHGDREVVQAHAASAQAKLNELNRQYPDDVTGER